MSIKLLFVINGLGTGGAERSLAEMLPHFVQARIKPLIICLHRRREGVEKGVIQRGFDVRFLNGKGLASRVYELRRMIRTERPDLIHTTLFESNLLGRLAGAGGPVPVMNSLVNTPYDPIRLRDPNIRTPHLRAVQWVDAWTARTLTTHFHAITRAVKAATVKSMHIQPERITVIERGRDPRRLGQPSAARRRRARDRLELCEDDEVLVNVGRQEYQKGQRYLLEAVERLLRTRRRLVLLVAGRLGHASAELERLRDRPTLQGRVRFLGHRDDVPEILAAADLFVFPSLFEGLGCSVIEAMALGLPIVASNIPALQEVLEEGQNALLVPPQSPGELAAAMSELLDDRERAAAFGRRSREIFEERFTLDRSTSRIIELYHRVLSASPACCNSVA